MEKSIKSAAPVSQRQEDKPPQPAGLPAARGESPLRPEDLRVFPILKSLSDGELQFIASKLSLASSFGGQIGARTKVAEVRFSLVLSGEYRIVALSAEGACVTLRSIGPTGHFGEMGILAKRAPGNWALIADKPGDVLYMYHADLTEVLERVPDLRTELLCVTAGYAAGYAQRIFELAILTPRARLLAELARLADRGIADGQWVVLRPAPTHDALAAQIGTTREAVSRNMKSLRKEGLLLSRRREIILTDMPRLRELVDGQVD